MEYQSVLFAGFTCCDGATSVFGCTAGDLADHVLGRFSGEDRARVEEAIRDAEDAAVLMIQGEADKAMNDFNAKKQENTK